MQRAAAKQKESFGHDLQGAHCLEGEMPPNSKFSRNGDGLCTGDMDEGSDTRKQCPSVMEGQGGQVDQETFSGPGRGTRAPDNSRDFKTDGPPLFGACSSASTGLRLSVNPALSWPPT